MTAVDQMQEQTHTPRGLRERFEQRWRQRRQEGRGERRRRQNVNQTERLVSVAAGSILAAMGVRRRDTLGWILAGLGGGLIYRGATGSCPMYKALGVDTLHVETRPEEYQERGTHVTETFSVGKPAAELYAFWRNFENLPRIMPHLQSVTVLDERRSHWVTKAPTIAGGQVEWDAEIINDVPNELIAWRSLPGADVPNAGSVRFLPAPGDRGTTVRAVIEYLPPAGAIGKALSKLFTDTPEHQIREDLRGFKRIMETGEIPTIDGQPRGTCTGVGRREVFTEAPRSQNRELPGG